MSITPWRGEREEVVGIKALEEGSDAVHGDHTPNYVVFDD
jgi:hypothetical protein